MSKKERLIKEVNEYFEDPERGGAGGCNDWHDFRKDIGEIIEKVFEKRELQPLEIRAGRSESYYEISEGERWAEDKRLGILDWDGTEEWLDEHGK